MGKAIPFDYRLKIVSEIEKGKKVKDVAQEMGYSESGIRKIWKAYQKIGEKAYQNQYSNCGRNSIYKKEDRDRIAELRGNNQGGSYIHSKLRQKYPTVKIPSERTLQRWWKEEGTNRPRGRVNNREKKVE